MGWQQWKEKCICRKFQYQKAETYKKRRKMNWQSYVQFMGIVTMLAVILSRINIIIQLLQ